MSPDGSVRTYDLPVARKRYGSSTCLCECSDAAISFTKAQLSPGDRRVAKALSILGLWAEATISATKYYLDAKTGGDQAKK